MSTIFVLLSLFITIGLLSHYGVSNRKKVLVVVTVITTIALGLLGRQYLTENSSQQAPKAQRPMPETLISLDYPRADLREVLLAFGDPSGMDIVLDPEIQGEVRNLTLTNIPWGEALEIVLDQYGLVQEVRGSVIIINSPEFDELRWQVTFVHQNGRPYHFPNLTKIDRWSGLLANRYRATAPGTASAPVTLDIREMPNGSLGGTWENVNGSGTWNASPVPGKWKTFSGPTKTLRGNRRGESNSIILSANRDTERR